MILINADSDTGVAGHLNFFQPDGNDLSVSLGEEISSEFDFQIPAGGGSLLRGRSTGRVAKIAVDGRNPSASEVSVNLGQTTRLNPVALDSEGNVVEDVRYSYLSLSPDIASVDSTGLVEGKQRGFSTLTVAAGDVLRTTTITVLEVVRGAAGFQITGVEPDPTGRLFLANTSAHTILPAEDLETMPELYAGMVQVPGLLDSNRLASRFRSPSYLALDRATANLYLNDRDNHVVRFIESGEEGQVGTVARTGEAGQGTEPSRLPVSATRKALPWTRRENSGLQIPAITASGGSISRWGRSRPWRVGPGLRVCRMEQAIRPVSPPPRGLHRNPKPWLSNWSGSKGVIRRLQST